MTDFTDPAKHADSAAALEAYTTPSIVDLMRRHLSVWKYGVSHEEQEWGEVGLRTNRAILSLERAASERNADTAYVHYWVAFNSAYGSNIDVETTDESRRFGGFFDLLLELDEPDIIYNTLYDQLSESVNFLLKNKYLFVPYWESLEGRIGKKEWQGEFDKSSRRISEAYVRNDLGSILSILFDRLYLLHNQLKLGGSKWGSYKNQRSVRHGSEVLYFFVPLFLTLMMDNPETFAKKI